jgi:hypothetical protein
LDRGKLLIPSSNATDVTLNICYTWRGLVKEETNRCKLLGCDLPKEVFIEVVSILMSEHTYLSETNCAEGHRLANTLLRQMAGVLFNLFAGNMVRDLNSDVHSKRKSSGAMRSQSDDKRRKLAGLKKSKSKCSICTQ